MGNTGTNIFKGNNRSYNQIPVAEKIMSKCKIVIALKYGKVFLLSISMVNVRFWNDPIIMRDNPPGSDFFCAIINWIFEVGYPIPPLNYMYVKAIH